MRVTRLLAAIAIALPAAALAAESVTIVHGTRIITADATRPFVDAMAYDDGGAIVALGDLATLRTRYADARVVDVGERTIVPGLIDAHGHVLGLGLTLDQADLVGTTSKADVIARLVAFAAKLPEDAWLLGRGWDQNDWPEQAFPTAADLDAAFPDRPVWLERVDGHAAWGNTAAMKHATRDLAGDWQPGGGKIERVDGRPTGIFIDGAMHVVESAIPKLSTEMTKRALTAAMREAVKHGLTGVHDAGVSREALAAYRALADAKQLPLRITAMADGDGDALDDLCKTGLYRHASGRLQMRTVKLYADGALGSRGAALLDDYSDDHGNRGLLVTSPDALKSAIAKAQRCGVQVAVHAIGDRGNRAVLDAFATHLDRGRGAALRWRIEHAQVVALDDIPRFATLGVIASMQPTHATSDMPWAEQRVGASRIAGAYAWRKFRDAGVPLALGSDFPVERVDPMLGLYAAITREDVDGKPARGWYANERLTPWEALRGFTRDAAYAGFAEDTVGTLAVGKRADFVVLAHDPVGEDAKSLLRANVVATVVDGEVVHGKL